jgi:hypothetical protein
MSHKDVTVANTNEFADGEMKQVSAEGIQLAKTDALRLCSM